MSRFKQVEGESEELKRGSKALSDDVQDWRDLNNTCSIRSSTRQERNMPAS